MNEFGKQSTIPAVDDVAWFEVDHQNKRQILIQKDMLIKQLTRDGPIIAASFDKLASETLCQCSELTARSYGALLAKLPCVDDEGFEATSSRLIATAINNFTASVEVARHGYPLQYGTLVRGIHETLAVVLVLATEKMALEDFHGGKLKSTKCITKAKQILPHVGQMWAWYSDFFVHIGAQHASLDPPKVWVKNDAALRFITQSMRHDSWLIYVVVELVFCARFSDRLYWQRDGQGFVFSPNERGQKQMEEFLFR